MSNIKPLNGIIVLKKLEEEEQTYGQIVIPDMGKEKPEFGIVVAVSDTYNWHAASYKRTDLQIGQKVVIPKMGTMNISEDGEDYILIKESDVLAIIEN
jgi:chaperonin GroES